MKKILLVLSLLGLVFAESNINCGFWGNYNTPSDYPTCCEPQTVNNGCRTRCCRKNLIGRPRWTCCKTLRCCKPKKVCCPRYKCCKPKRGCCPTEVPVCETSGCVTTPRTTCYEDREGMSTYASSDSSYMNNQTTCTEDYSNMGGYPTSYGEPTIYGGYNNSSNQYEAQELV